MNICVIPARGGSKRIPRKNIKDFCGKPMIAWSIKAALASNCFDQVIVSTDDTEIAQVAKQYGANVPFMRPQDLADDYTGTIPVIAHAIDELENQGSNINTACCIYATAPFIKPQDIKQGFDLLLKSNTQFVMSVTSYPFPIQRAVILDQDNHLQMLQPDNFQVRSQDLEEAYHDAAQFYFGQKSAWQTEKNLFNSNTQAVILPRWQVQDIDTPEDWNYAELMFKAQQLI